MNSDCNRLPELLAPAGNPEKMKIAWHYGADAVYLGFTEFSLRAMGRNFDAETLATAIRDARRTGKRVYVTANVIAHNRNLQPLKEHFQLLAELRPHGVIVSDPGVFDLLAETAPELERHISTQANVTNAAGARFWQRLGAHRLILARELTLEEIREIRAAIDIDLECFVHGSICISYSGKCYMSTYMTGKSANAGDCTNSCRWKYDLVEEKRPGQYFPVMEDEHGAYLMNSKDLCLIQHLDELMDSGVNSFKIEGRMKGIHYLASVIHTYRQAIDSLHKRPYRVDPSWLRELMRIPNRGYTTGEIITNKEFDTYYGNTERVVHHGFELIGTVLDVDANRAMVALRNSVSGGDEILYLSPGLEERPIRLHSIQDSRGRDVDRAGNNSIIHIECPAGVRPGDVIRRNAPAPALAASE